MPAPTSTRASPRPSPFLEQMVRFLMPFFLGSATDFDAARADVLETLASYGARTRSQMLNAAQIIAFGMSALETLAEIDSTEMSPSMRLRYRACANSLNRSGQQHDKSLATRLACDAPDVTEAAAETELPEAEVQRAVEQTKSKIEACRNRLSGARPAGAPPPATASNQHRNKQLWGGAMMGALSEMGMPVVPDAAPKGSAPRGSR